MNARWGLVALSLCTLMPSLDTSIANAGLPMIAHSLEAPFQQVQWVVIAYLLAITTTIVSAGRLGDRVGRRRVLSIGIGVFTIASAACGAAPSLAVLVGARAVQGIGAALLLALAIAFVGDAVPRERIGATMGLLGTMSAVGTTLGPSFGGLLMSALGWRAIFLANVPIGVLTLFFAVRHLPADIPRASETGVRFDLLGTVLLVGSLAAYALAMTVGRGHFGATNLLLLAFALVGIIAFLRVEATAAAPLVPVLLLREPRLVGGLTMTTLVSTVMMATLVVGPFYLARGLGLGPAMVGLTLSVGPLCTALSGVPGGRLVDRLGSRRMTLVGLVAITVGAAVQAVIPHPLGVAAYLAPIVVMTSGYALFQAANNTAIVQGAPSSERGVIAGMLSLARNLGLITGASAMGAVFAGASRASTHATVPGAAEALGMRVTFAVAAALGGIALLQLLRQPD